MLIIMLNLTFVNVFFNINKSKGNPILCGGLLMKNRKDVGKNILRRIDDLLKEKKITRAELERRADLGNGTLRNWSSSIPSIDKVQRVAAYFGVSLDFLYNGEDNDEVRMLAREIENLDSSTQETIKKIVLSFKKK